MVIRGQATLDRVLKGLFVRQRRDRFVRDGLDPSLAGQVANGRLDLQRAKRIQTVWQAQSASFHSDRMKALAGCPVAMAVFGQGLRVGRLAHVGRYDLVLESGPDDLPETFKKHDVKFYCRAEEVQAVEAMLGQDPETAALGLGPSTMLAERWRPDEELAIRWATDHPVVRFRFRDGQTLAGTPQRVALYEIEIACSTAKVGVLTHALHQPHPFDVG